MLTVCEKPNIDNILILFRTSAFKVEYLTCLSKAMIHTDHYYFMQQKVSSKTGNIHYTILSYISHHKTNKFA